MSEIAINDSIESQPDDELPSATTVALVQLALACGVVTEKVSATFGSSPMIANSPVPMPKPPQAGYVISAYALGVVIGAPVIAVLAAKMARR